MSSVYLRPPVASVEEAIARMDAIDRHIDQHEPRRSRDGVACFNHLYGVITRRVLQGIRSHFFADTEFLTVLDIAFANRYLDALRAHVRQPGAVPRSWKVLIERRSDDRVESIQFSVAGVNAHINLDLAVALRQTFDALGRRPSTGSQRPDYQKVNQIFAEEMESLRQHFQDELQRRLDEIASPTLNLLGNWSVEAARDAAWALGEQLWLFGQVNIDDRPVVAHVDRVTGLAGHFLLTPLA